ncbi:MAG: hypothetical protein JWN61_2806 [Pseudonocardiales bacterium]|nr:hypothetical protein [Jatrophihabitantaceae bacterium]MCW2604671.1 hypothetical protein [Pseudonocardiales bacterium]
MAEVTLLDTAVLLELEEAERTLLTTVLSDMDDALQTLQGDDPVRKRLLPDGYRGEDGGPGAAAEFREMTEQTLIEGKSAAIGLCAAELATVDETIGLTLDPEALGRWLRVLTDVRLALGTRIGVGERRLSLLEQLRLSGSQRAAWGAYGWLTDLQESLTLAAMGETRG